MVPSVFRVFAFHWWLFSLFSVCHAQTNGQVRLVDGLIPREGRVEIYYNGTWGTVCDDDWDVNDATVVCRQLGYSSGISTQSVRAYSEAFFGQGNITSPIWLDNVDCAGTENQLMVCKANAIGVHDCGHREDAGVFCSNDQTAESSPYNLSTTVGPAAAAGGLLIAFLVVTVVLIVYRHRNAPKAIREEEREPRMYTEFNVYESLHAHHTGPVTATATSQNGAKVQTSASSDPVHANCAFDTEVDHIYVNTAVSSVGGHV